MHPELAHVLATQHAVSRHGHPHLQNAIRHSLSKGELIPLLPGTYCAEASFLARANAVQLWDCNAVLTGGTAAKLSWWPELRWDDVGATCHRASTRAVGGITIRKGQVDPDLVMVHEGFQMVHPSWSALELTDHLGGLAIDQALRRRATSLAAMRWAMKQMSGRAGNVQRAQLLLDSKDSPWSENERTAHRMLREARITGWEGNARVVLRSGAVRFLDVALRQRKIGVEIDSWGGPLES